MIEILTALITPFLSNEQIDYESLGILVEQQIQDGCDGFIVCGTTAEVPTLSRVEKLEILDFVIEKTNNRIPIWYGCGSNNTSLAIMNCKEVEDRDIAGVLLVTPYYNRPSQEGLFAHFSKIAKSTSLNVMLYNIPSRTGCEIKEETLRRLLRKHFNIVALKHADKELSMIAHIHDEFPHFRIYSGEDGYFCEGIKVGMCGVVSVISHLILARMKIFVNEHFDDDEEMKNIYDCANKLFLESSPSPLKYILSKQKRCLNVLRLPMVSIAEDTKATLEVWLSENDNILHESMIK